MFWMISTTKYDLFFTHALNLKKTIMMLSKQIFFPEAAYRDILAFDELSLKKDDPSHETVLKSSKNTGDISMFVKPSTSDGTEFASVSHIDPLTQALGKRYAALEIFDDFQNMGNKDAFVQTKGNE
jgi:hypothetical protein